MCARAVRKSAGVCNRNSLCWRLFRRSISVLEELSSTVDLVAVTGPTCYLRRMEDVCEQHVRASNVMACFALTPLRTSCAKRGRGAQNGVVCE
jgi:hypothetical protein